MDRAAWRLLGALSPAHSRYWAATICEDSPMQFRPLIVDRLPRTLWKPGNLHLPFSHTPFSDLPEDRRVTGRRLHFCEADSVRNIEWDDRGIGAGVDARTHEREP